MISASQIKAARALLGVSQAELAKSAGLGLATVKRVEAASKVRGAAETLWKIQKALEAAGIEFIPAEGSKGPGVRLRQDPNAQAPREAAGTPSTNGSC